MEDAKAEAFEAIDQIFFALIASLPPQHESFFVVLIVNSGLADTVGKAARHLGGRVGSSVGYVLDEATDVAFGDKAGHSFTQVVKKPNGISLCEIII